jgi:hypothetical protein
MGVFAALYPKDEIPMFLVFVYLQRAPVIVVTIVFMVAETAYVASGIQDGVGHLVHLGSLISGLAIAPLLKWRMEKSKSISKVIEKPDYSALENLAITDELKTILERIKKEDNKEIHDVWLNFFIDNTKCPKCNSKLSYIGNSIHCKCGFEIKSQPKL